jgi:endonuclease YncB( thermonuclease family)
VLSRFRRAGTPRSYGRLLAYVFRQTDNLLVNKEIIRQGYGHAYTKYPFDPARMEEFRAADQNLSLRNLIL